MSPETVRTITQSVKELWSVTDDLEVTLEANPTSVEREKFQAFHEAGVNRVSLGIQSLEDKDLRFLGRTHTSSQALEALETARAVFDRYSFDLIYALPEQSLKAWEKELQRALLYVGDHMSLYQLTIERKTPFYMAHSRGDFSMPGEELAADFYMLTQEIMNAHKLPAYEVSNHAVESLESRHNMTYWQYGDYIGIGPGAHGRVTLNNKRYATRTHAAPNIWLERITEGSTGEHPRILLDKRDQALETLIMGLRLRKGVSLGGIINFIHKDNLDRMIKEHWAVLEDQTLKLTTEGRLRLNAIVPYIFKDEVSAQEKTPA